MEGGWPYLATRGSANHISTGLEENSHLRLWDAVPVVPSLQSVLRAWLYSSRSTAKDREGLPTKKAKRPDAAGVRFLVGRPSASDMSPPTRIGVSTPEQPQSRRSGTSLCASLMASLPASTSPLLELQFVRAGRRSTVFATHNYCLGRYCIAGRASLALADDASGYRLRPPDPRSSATASGSVLRQAQDAVIRPRAHTQLRHRRPQQASSGTIHTELPHLRHAHVGVAGQALALEACLLYLPRCTRRSMASEGFPRLHTHSSICDEISTPRRRDQSRVF